jgi:hypothetical protein
LSLIVVEVSGNGNDSVLNCLSQIGLGHFFHFGEDHGRYLLRVEFFGLSFVLNNNHWLVISSGLDLEWPMLHVLLDNWIRKLSSD